MWKRWAWPRDHKIAFGSLVVATAGLVVAVTVPIVTTGGGTTNVPNQGAPRVVINNNGGTVNILAAPSAVPGTTGGGSAPGSATGGLSELPAEPIEYAYYPARLGYECTSSACTVAPAVTLDSAINNPVVADERPFFCGSVAGRAVQNRLKVKPGDVVTLRVYANNDADPAYLGSTQAIARDVHLSVLIPTVRRNWFNLVAFLSGANTTPNRIDDPMTVEGGRQMKLLFIGGSARVFRLVGGNATSSALDDRITTAAGVSLGDLAPGTGNAVFVTLQVRVVAA